MLFLLVTLLLLMLFPVLLLVVLLAQAFMLLVVAQLVALHVSLALYICTVKAVGNATPMAMSASI